MKEIFLFLFFFLFTQLYNIPVNAQIKLNSLNTKTKLGVELYYII